MKLTISRLAAALPGLFLLHDVGRPGALSPRHIDVPAEGQRPAAFPASLPVDFVENRGQWSDPAKFVARKGSLVAAFDEDAIRRFEVKD